MRVNGEGQLEWNEDCPFETAVFYFYLLQILLKILQAQTSECDQSLRGRVIRECEDSKIKTSTNRFLTV